jgi:hypothetical protein
VVAHAALLSGIASKLAPIVAPTEGNLHDWVQVGKAAR